jgi:hypothetical protein
MLLETPIVGRLALAVPQFHSRSVNYLQEWSADRREVNFNNVSERWRSKVLAATA